MYEFISKGIKRKLQYVCKFVPFLEYKIKPTPFLIQFKKNVLLVNILNILNKKRFELKTYKNCLLLNPPF